MSWDEVALLCCCVGAVSLLVRFLVVAAGVVIWRLCVCGNKTHE